MSTNDCKSRPSSPEVFDQARWIPALILIAIGAAFLLNNLHIVAFHELFQYWPVILIAIGLFRLVDSSQSNQRLVGAILILVGGFLLAGTLGFFYLSWGTIWPLLLIGAGLLMLVQRLSLNIGVTASADFSPKTLHESASFSGGDRKIKGDFKGGKLDCIFGGFDVNMRQATMSADSAELEINAVFGGAEIKIPESWEVVMRGTGVFGGYGDETTHPDPRIYPNPKRLIIKGGAVFGGVNVKN
jgi:LiaF transmembrane domain